MITDARQGAGGQHLEADVCVIGAGPVGVAVALRLVELGLEVIVLEAGSLEPDNESQRLAVGEISGLAYDSLEHARGRSFGGSAQLWNVDLGGGMPGARMRRLDTVDFSEREWMPHSGWPFTLETLVPYYEQAESFFGIDGQSYALPSARSDRDPILNENSPLEGTVFRFSIATSILDRRQQLADECKLTLLLNAIVVKLERSSDGQDISRVHAMSLTGNDYTVQAEAYVLATGGIENARLLLMTDIDGDGEHAIGNEHGLLGRYFMEHPHTRAGFLLPKHDDMDFLLKEVSTFEDALGEPWFRVRDDVAAEHRLGNMAFALKMVPQAEMRRVRAMGSPSQAVRTVRKLRKRNEGDSLELMRTVLKGAPEIAGAAIRKARFVLGEKLWGVGRRDQVSFRLDVMGEQVPNPASRVTLSKRLDPIGMPRPSLHWAMSKQDFSALARLSKLVADLVESRGIGKLTVPFEPSMAPINWGFHHMGTTRMHSDPAWGVVDEFGRVHEMENLYVVGSSVFPTGGVSNPTLTAVAVSLRTAEHLAGEVGIRSD